MEGADGRGEGRSGGAGPHVEGGRGSAAAPGEREAAGGGRGAWDGGAAEWGRRENVGHPHGAAARGLRAAHRVLRGGEEQLWGVSAGAVRDSDPGFVGGDGVDAQELRGAVSAVDRGDEDGV